METKGKTGVLIGNLGTPDGYDYWSMRRYLNEFLSDRRVIDYAPWKWQPLLQLIILTKRPFSSGRAYKSIWNTEADESPLMTITRNQAEKLEQVLADRYGGEVVMDFCMRYGNPSTGSKVKSMVAAGCDKILFFPLYPQHAGATTATANDAFFRALCEEKQQPAARTVPAYYGHPDYICALADSIREAYDRMQTRPDHLIVSYHGMPERYIREGDPYLDHCRGTTALLQRELGWGDGEIITTFQSQFGPEEWLKPYTVEEVARLATRGRKSIAVVAPAFASDCIETLEEINEEIFDSFKEAGGEAFTYIPCLNDRDDHIDALVEIIGDNLAGWVAKT
jgi:ferrochelatase